VSVESAKWQWALGELGFTTVTVAGEGQVDRMLPGLSISGAADPPTQRELAGALDQADVVIVENLCSLPLNRPAADAVARILAGRPAVLHHHDLPWQRPQFVGDPPPPIDPRWSHVTINELSRDQLADRGIAAHTVYNTFAIPSEQNADAQSGGDVAVQEVRSALGIEVARRLVLQPTRAIPRKNVAGGIAAATALGAVYWLLGPAEDGYSPELDALVAAAECPVLLGPPDGLADFNVDQAYRACDVVALPSTWEGFGNPTVESVVHGKPLVIGPYPVAQELAAFGFDWFALSETDRLAGWLDSPDPALLERNLAVARRHFSLADLPAKVAAILPEL
jgi:mannosylglucosylglycerate synthase